MNRLALATILAMCGSLRAAELTSLLIDAQIQFQETHYEQALKLYKQAQDEAGTNAPVEYNIGLCHLRLGDGDKAIQHFESVASQADASASVRRDAFFNVGVIRATTARQRLDELLDPQTAEDAETPPLPADAPENIQSLQAIATELLRAIALFRECEKVAPSDDAQHNMRAVRITRRNVLGLLKSAIEAKQKEDMLDDPTAYLNALIGEQRTAVGLTRHLILGPPEDATAQRRARRSILRLQRQIMERTDAFVHNLAQFVESTNQTTTAPTEPAEGTAREQVCHSAAEQLEESIPAQRDASAFMMDGETERSLDEQMTALDQMYVALRLFPQELQKTLVEARTVQHQLREMVLNIKAEADWYQDALLGQASIPEDAKLEPEKTALHQDQAHVVATLSALRAQCDQVGKSRTPEDEGGSAAQDFPREMDPELNRRIADALAGLDALTLQCLDAVAAREKDATLDQQHQVLDMIDAALNLLPKSIEQQIAELVVRQARLNEEVKAEASGDLTLAEQQTDAGLDELHALAAEARSDVLDESPSQVAQRFHERQEGIHVDTQAVQEELRQRIPAGGSDAGGALGMPPGVQSQDVNAYIEAAKHIDQAGFEMLVALEGLDKAIVQDALGPMKTEGPVQAAQFNAQEELLKALAALRPPDQKSQDDQQDQQDQQQQPEQEDRGREDARRAVERAEEEREEAERQLHQRRPRTVIKDW